MDAPTVPVADDRVRVSEPRTRTALVLLALALVVPLVAGFVGPPVTGVGNPFAVLGAVALAGAVLGTGAAAIAPVGIGPRAAVVALALVNGAGGLWLMTIDGPGRFGLATLASAITGPLRLPALAWLGAALATELGDRVRRSWRTSLLLAMAIAGLQVLLSVVAAGTYGAALRFSGGFTTYVLLTSILGGAATVGVVHVVVSAVRTWRARAGAPPPTLRPWLLAAALAVAGAVSTVGVLLSDVV